MRNGLLSVRRKRIVEIQPSLTVNRDDNWDHVAYDPEHRLVLRVVPDKRTTKNVDKLMVYSTINFADV